MKRISDKTQNNDKLHKAAKGASIAVKAVLVLCGVALLTLFAWLGFKIYSWLGGAL